MADLVTNQSTLRIASRDAIRSDGSGGKLLYRGDLSRGSSFRFSRSLQFWPWGRSSGSPAAGELRIDNGDGSYDGLVTIDSRNFRTSFRRVVNGVEQAIVTPLLDTVEAPSDREIVFKLIDPLALFDVPLQLDTFDESADPAVQGQPLPIMIGVCRSVPAILWDANHVGGAYRLSYMPLAGIAAVFDSAVALDPVVPQWEFDTRIGNAGFFLNQSTAGKITADASAIGDGTLPAEPVDLANGRGVFSAPFAGVLDPPSWSQGPTGVGMPEGWYVAGGSAGQGDTVTHLVAASGKPDRMRITHRDPSTTQPFGNIGLTLLDDTSAVPFRFTAGRRVRISFGLVSLTGGWTGTVAGFTVTNPAILSLRFGTGDTSGLFGRRIRQWRTFSPEAQPGRRTLTITPHAGMDGQPLQIFLQGPFAAAEIADLEIVEIPDVSSISLPGVTLADYMREIVRLSRQPESDVQFSDLDALDPAAAEIGYFSDQQVQALSMIRLPLDSYTADAYSDRAGKIRFTRMVDPATQPSAATITPDSLKTRPRVWIDRAPSLTTAAAARRNYYVHNESELAGSIVDLPLDQRKQWTQQHRVQVRADLPDGLPEQYRHALGASPLPTLYDDPARALAEIQRVAEIYQTIRLFVEVELWIDATEALLDLGQIVTFRYPRWGFKNGRKMMVVLVDDLLQGEERRPSARFWLWG